VKSLHNVNPSVQLAKWTDRKKEN